MLLFYREPNRDSEDSTAKHVRGKVSLNMLGSETQGTALNVLIEYSTHAGRHGDTGCLDKVQPLLLKVLPWVRDLEAWARDIYA